MNNKFYFHGSLLKRVFLIQILVVSIGAFALIAAFQLLALKVAEQDRNTKIALLKSYAHNRFEEWAAWQLLGMHDVLNSEMNSALLKFDLKRISMVNLETLKSNRDFNIVFVSNNTKLALIAEVEDKSLLDMISDQRQMFVAMLSLFSIFAGVSYVGLVYLRKNIHLPLFRLVNRFEQRALGGPIPYENIEAKGEIKYFIDQIQNLNLKVNEMEKSSALGKMASQVSHDLASPISTLEVVFESVKMPNDERELLSLSIQRIKEITSNLLSQSKIDHFRDTTFLILETSQLLRMKKVEPLFCEEAEFIFNSNNISESDMLKINPTDFCRMLSNLINNAFESYDSGKKIINVALNKTKNEILVSIQDYGKGMNAQQLSTVGVYGKTYKAKGSGIGLHSANEFMKSIGGKLEVNSVIGEGTVVTLVFPI